MRFTVTRTLALMMALLMLSLAACSKRSEPSNEAPSSSSEPPSQSEPAPPLKTINRLTIEEAEQSLAEHLANTRGYVIGDDYLESDGAQASSVMGIDCYTFSWRYGQQYEGIQDRLEGNYAISVDAARFFYYDRGEDAWFEDEDAEEAPPPSSIENNSASAEFSLGRDGAAKTMRTGDTLGDWKLANLKVDYSGDGALNMLRATFEGNVTLRGTVTRNFLSEVGYDFTVAKEDEARMPFYVSPEMSYKDDYLFILNFSEELGNPVTLDFDESLDCTVTISDYHFTFAFMTSPDSATVVAIEAR